MVVKFIKEIFMWYVWFGKKILPFVKYGGVILLGLLVVLSFAQNLPIPGNFQSLVVMSGSMEPKIRVGSVAVIKPSEEVKAGDIITFRDPRDPKNLITHRVVEISENGIIKTKGDANQAPDNWEIKKEDIVGKLLFSIPYLGYAVNFAKKPQGFLLLILFPAILIIINEIWVIKNELVNAKNAKDEGSKRHQKETLAAVAVSAVLLTFAFSSGKTLALLSDTETSTGNTISAGVWASAGDVVINELMWTGSVGDPGDEWLELRNTTGGEIDIGGWQLTKKSGGSEVLMIEIPIGEKIPPYGFYLISEYDEAHSKIKVTPDLVSGDGDKNESEFALVNNQLQIKLYNGAWDGGATLIDTADDGIGAPAAGDNSNKFSMERNDTPGDGTQASNWHTCLDASSTGLYWDTGATERGTPGAANLSENDPSVQEYILLNSSQNAKEESESKPEPTEPAEPAEKEAVEEELESESPSKSEKEPEKEDEDKNGDGGEAVPEDPPESSESAKLVPESSESAKPKDSSSND